MAIDLYCDGFLRNELLTCEMRFTHNDAAFNTTFARRHRAVNVTELGASSIHLHLDVASKMLTHSAMHTVNFFCSSRIRMMSNFAIAN